MSEETQVPMPDLSVTAEPVQNTEVLPEGMVQRQDGSIQVLSTAAYKRMKEQAMQRGRKESENAFNEKLRSLGYSSFDELVNALNSGPKGSSSREENLDEDDFVEEQPKQTARPQPQQNREVQKMANGKQQQQQSTSAADREKQILRQQAERHRQRMIEEARRRRELERSLEAKEAEMAIRETAMHAGVRDIDYAVNLLARNLESKSEEELAAFDEKQFFSGLRNTHPYLFGEVSRPATTGPGVGVQPAPMKPGTVAQATAQNSQVDARKMNQSEFQDYLRSKGLSSPNASIGGEYR